MIPKTNPNRGPGDFLPADEPELADLYIDQAREELEANADGEPVSEDAVIERAWELQTEAVARSWDDAADDAAERAAWERDE